MCDGVSVSFLSVTQFNSGDECRVDELSVAAVAIIFAVSLERFPSVDILHDAASLQYNYQIKIKLS